MKRRLSLLSAAELDDTEALAGEPRRPSDELAPARSARRARLETTRNTTVTHRGADASTPDATRECMERTLARNWWAIALRGAFAILFGLIAFAWAEATPSFLGTVFGVFLLIEGRLA